MKKYLILFILIATPLIFSGCSLLPANQASVEPVANPNNSIWISGDSGASWINAYLPGTGKVDISGVEVLSMAVNPFDTKNVFVGLRGAGILKTDDGGLSWEYLKFESQKVYGLDIDPNDGRVIYASGVWQNRGKMFKSTDSGTTWKEIYTTAANGPLVIALTIDKKNPNNVFAATSDNQIIKTTDGGTSWKNVFTSNSPVLKIAVDKINNNLIYGVMQNGDILRSKDGGASFENITRQLALVSKSGLGVSLVEVDPGVSGRVYAAGGAGMFVSKDAGNSWEKIQILNNPQAFPVKALAVNPANSNEIIYGAAQAAYRSTDGGNNWAPFQFNLSKNVNIIKYATADPTQLYLGFSK